MEESGGTGSAEKQQLAHSVERDVEILRRASARYHHPLPLADEHHLQLLLRRHKRDLVVWNQKAFKWR